MRIAISGSNPGSKIDVEGLRTSAERSLAALDLGESELSIALVDDEEIRELNRQWREKPTATDVLSFSLVEGEFADHRGGLLGDVVISVETAARDARTRHRSLEEIVTRLMIHGVLHLIGHDHEDDEDAKRMRAEERRLWRVTRS